MRVHCTIPLCLSVRLCLSVCLSAGISTRQGEHVATGLCGGGAGGGAYPVLPVRQCGGRVQYPQAKGLAQTYSTGHTYD